MSATKQQYYRRLMKEQKSKLPSQQAKKVDHPFARYNALDQLMCVICSCQVKSEILWTTHLQSRKHKDMVAALKSKKSQPQPQSQSQPQPQPAPSSRHSGEGEEDQEPIKSVGKRKVSSDMDDASNGPPKKKSKRKNPSATPAPTPSGLPANFFDSGVSKKFHPHGEEQYYVESDSDDEGEAARPETMPTTKDMVATAPPSSLPKDFFDRGSEDTPATHTKSDDTKKGLPEGFFDDPKLDAKARKVEYKDPLDEEWDKFQKSIQKENDLSEVILLEEDEENMEEREVDEVNQQVRCFTKAEELRQKHEALQSKISERNGSQSENLVTMDSESSEDEVDFDEFLNWRAKIS